MTSAVNVRSQLIRVIFIFVGVIVQCHASTSPGTVFNDEDFQSIICLLNSSEHTTSLAEMRLVIS